MKNPFEIDEDLEFHMEISDISEVELYDIVSHPCYEGSFRVMKIDSDMLEVHRHPDYSVRFTDSIDSFQFDM